MCEGLNGWEIPHLSKAADVVGNFFEHYDFKSNYTLTLFNKTCKYIFLLITVGSLASCCRTEDCETGYLNIATINFSIQQSDTFIVRRYKVNTNFNLLVDTLLLARNINCFYTDQGLDTSFVIINESNPFRLNTGFDYILYFPATNTLRKISDITERKNQQKICATSNGKRCYNDITSYKVDGILNNNFHILIYK